MVDGNPSGIEPTLDYDGLAEVDAFSGNNTVADDQAIKQYEREHNNLAEQLEEANAMGNVDEVEQIKERMEALADEISKNKASELKKKRNQPEDGSIAKKTLDKISKNIKTAIAKIEKQSPKLAEHLSQSINNGSIKIYSPEETPDWHLK